MNEISWWPYLMTGIAAGVASGLFGIGGGLVIIPILIYFVGMDQHAASGTSLVALLLPVGIFAVWNYWTSGKIQIQHIRAGLWIGLGIALGAFAGSKIAVGLDARILRKLFAGFMGAAAVRLWFM